jgi:hypothetical protein
MSKKPLKKLGLGALKKSAETEEEQKVEAMKYTETGSIQFHGVNREGKQTSFLKNN